jgi:hypothetical protein
MSVMRNQRGKTRLKPSDLNVKMSLDRLWSIEIRFAQPAPSGLWTAVSLPYCSFSSEINQLLVEELTQCLYQDRSPYLQALPLPSH